MAKKIILLLVLIISYSVSWGANKKVYFVVSPNKKVSIEIQIGERITWSVSHANTSVIAPSELSLKLEDGEILGVNARVLNKTLKYHKEAIATSFYKKNKINNEYQELILSFKNGWGIVYRAYDDGVAYRFVMDRKKSQTVLSEQADFNFDGDYSSHVPYVCDLRDGDPYCSAFESLYDEIKISEFKADSLSVLPLLIDLKDHKKAVILEAALENYPGMYLTRNKKTVRGFEARFAKYPLETKVGGFHNLNMMPSKRTDYIAKITGRQVLPWRAVIIASEDKELLNNDMVYKLTGKSRILDTSWIKPGKVAWDWWNNWNISNVNFKAGVNTQTYKKYIDFAHCNGLEYIVMDEGWSISATDISALSPSIDLKEIITYGKQKGIGVILWASWRGLTVNMDYNLAHYANMGIAGFKIDFIDRDDQLMVKSCYEIAENAAKYKLLIDFHGMFKPSGLNVLYPNVLNFEGVRGMENAKWHNYDAPLYDVTMPYIRMLSGPIDYTPGAMRNASKSCFRPISDNPMSMGTRCHQLAMYIDFEAPLQMLADNPTAYTREQECTNFIKKVPTVFDETIALDGKIGQFLSIARRKGSTWYIGAMCNWNPMPVEVDFSFLPEGKYIAEVFTDGVNADRDATDYKYMSFAVDNLSNKTFQLLSGGGLAMTITLKQ